ncbi:hypothetical protein TraAM80_03346 [Trypanosoma rangeli]|uniref:Uncharacterized protein n=1 Tax=Trypanosoma rangeli TaxID=5698 RepID=A0A422NPQ0_TRYRA|nr:uncharacterized protein TraAM80_03346 [Trypanosoma rangeli]RNF07490.1 hypothetical protein TraAM80_03346 [Trypanosoma rangeli]|eukprot:RNF07490.1 hypothetical protein TraAM80_03346 [Trypanosoma rangeli]
MNNDNVGMPIPVSTIVVRRQCYPCVPPELLLREHAGKFYLSDLTPESLLNAVSPRVNPVLPPYLGSKGSSGGVNNDLVYALIRESVRLPPVPSDNIKELSPVAQRLKMEAEAQRRANTVPQSNIKKQLLAEDEGAFVFEEASTSHITAVEFLRMPAGRNDDSKVAEREEKKADKTLVSIYGSVPRDLKLEEGECLWGYNTGAVLLVSLRVYATDLRNRRFYEALSLPVQPSFPDYEREVNGFSPSGGSDSILSIAERQRNNLLGCGIATEERGFIRGMSKQAPHGVSLLGYHPVGGVCALVYDSHNDLAISGGMDGTLFVWDVHQQYRRALREKYMRDEDTKNMRPAQQFAAYIHTRRLTQRIPRAHNTSVSSLATYSELMISGGVDGTIKIWSCMHLAGITVHGAPPQYVEQQVFNCNGWVRDIWSSPERIVQGEDVLVTDENGSIFGFKGTTFSQEPVMQASYMEKKWLHALRRSEGHRLGSAFFETRRNSTDRRGLIQFPALAARRPSSGPPIGGLLKPATNEEDAMKLLRRGIITQALRLTRKLQIIGEEARLAVLPGSNHSARNESTSSITRIIPLEEQKLFIVLGYSPMVRFLDMTHLNVASVVVHPSLRAASGEEKGGSVQAASPGNPRGSRKGQQRKPLSNASTQKKSFLMSGNASGGGAEALRFVDVLYVTSLSYLLLLDNRNTVFVWDNVEKVFLTSWKSPVTNESGKTKTALRLLSCGTRHYKRSGNSGRGRISRELYGKAKRRGVCFHEQANNLEDNAKMEDEAGDITIPFFVVCNTGVELCDVVIETEARLEFRGHQDAIVGIFLRNSPPSSVQRIEKRPKTMLEVGDAFEKKVCGGANISSYDQKIEKNISSRTISCLNDKFKGSNSDVERDLGPESEWFKYFLRQTEAGGRIYVLSCSVDGDTCFWGSSFEPLSVYHHGSVSEKNFEFCTTVLHEPFPRDGVASPFGAPPCTIKKKNGVGNEVESGGNDVTAFYYYTRWNLAVTGHDDGSIRYWPCGNEVATCVWHKGLHSNTVSGLVAARIVEQEDQLGTLARIGGSVVKALIAREPDELLASVSFDGYLAVWEYPEQAKAKPHGRTRISFNELICLAFDEINELFIVGDSAGTVSSWHARGLEPRCSVPSRPPSPWRPSATALKLSAADARVFGPAPNTATWSSRHRGGGISSSSSGGVTLGSSLTQEKGKARLGHTEAVTALVVDGNFVFSGGEDGRVFLWDLRIGVLLREYILLHDTDEIAQHCRKVKSAATMQSSSRDSTKINSRSTEDIIVSPGRAVKLYSENVTAFALLKRRNGDLLVATREGWLYHFGQSCTYPRSTYKHSSSVRCMCVLHDGCAEDNTDLDDDESHPSKEVLAFELVIGDDEGNMAVIREPHFNPTL